MKKTPEKEAISVIPFEEALEQTGNGLYNILLVAANSWILMAIGMDLINFNVVVAAACDLNLSVTEKGILTSLPFVGIIIVSYIWGYVADTYGRRFTLLISVTFGFLLSTLSSFSPNWIVLGVIRFFSVCFSSAAQSLTYSWVGESCVQRKRNKYMLLMTCLFVLSSGLGAILALPILRIRFVVPMPCLGIVFKPWRLYIIVLALPSGIGAILIYLLYESPKFLANCGRNKEALKVLRSIHKMNYRGSEEYKVKALKLEESKQKYDSLLKSMYEQSATLFRPPFLKRTLQMFYIVAVVYITNNSFLMWLPHIVNEVMTSINEGGNTTGNVCSYLSSASRKIMESVDNTTSTIFVRLPEDCVGTVKDSALITMFAAQSIFALLNIVISYLSSHRKAVVLTILCISGLSAICVNLMPEAISSVIFYVSFTCTCMAMGILFSYLVDLYPTSYRGMISCLSVMVARASAFLGINLVGNIIFTHCEITFYCWSILVFSSVVVAWYLPPDKPPKSQEQEVEDTKL